MFSHRTSLSRRAFLRRTSGAAAGLALAGAGLAQPFLASAATSLGPGDTAVVADGPLNLRSGAGLGHSVKDVLPTGTRVLIGDGPVSADGYTWLYVMDSPTGWVAAEFLAPESSSRFVVADGPLNVRQGAGLDAPIIGLAETGAYGTATAPDSTQADGYMWAAVAFDSGLRGWIALEFVDWL